MLWSPQVGVGTLMLTAFPHYSSKAQHETAQVTQTKCVYTMICTYYTLKIMPPTHVATRVAMCREANLL